MDFKDWASRHTGRGPSKAPAPQPRAAVQAPPVNSPGELPPPPPGYGYVPNPQYGFVLVPLGQGQAQVAAPAAYPQPMRRVAAAPKEFTSCELVKPGNVDTYAAMLANVPELVADSGYDSMNGQPSPETLEALRGDALFSQSMNQPSPRAFTSAAHRPAVKIAPLAGS